MSVIFGENNYRILRNNDPAYQAMTRISDANNTYDVRQQYVKTGITRNDFETQLNAFRNNRGILNDGLYVDMSNFFTDTQKILINGVETIIGKEIPYFKFKTNSILNYTESSRYKDTYVDKTKVESIYEIEEYEKDGSTLYKYSDLKSLVENKYNSYPLQRVDKRVIHELDSLFVYVDGKKIPDNKVFIYTTDSCTDVFIPQSCFSENIESVDSYINSVITIDYRQPGSEGFYFYDELKNTRSVLIDLTDPKYSYQYTNPNSLNITKEKLLVFVDGMLASVESIERNGTDLTVNFASELSGEIEIYILNNVIYRYKIPETSMINQTGSKVFFYLNDDYKTDVISGPITKNAVSFWYDGKRVDDSQILQNSRYSFELTVDLYTFKRVNTGRPIGGEIYYILNSHNQFERLGTLTQFEQNVVYYVREAAPKFDESKIDFIIEDIDRKIDDFTYKTFGDDYYLLNMLGVKRCVDKMKGTKSYSIFDDQRYNIAFKEVLSKNGELFDVQKAIEKYNDIGYNTRTPNERIKRLIQERPTLLRRLLEQVKIDSKRFIVVGNSKDIVVSSVNKIEDPEQNIYYKIYVNHNLIEAEDFSTVRENNFDTITIKKERLDPLTYNSDGSLKSGRNEIEIFQYDLSYKSSLIYKDNIANDFESFIDVDGSRYFEKTYQLSELPFKDEFLTEDICAIEKVDRNWYDRMQPEYNYIYADENMVGYRIVKYFEIIEKTDETMRIRIKLHDYDQRHTGSNFFMLKKEYNVVERITITNPDRSYMEANDLLIPVYSTYTKYGIDNNGHKFVLSEDEYIPYINTSEPILTCNGKEMIYGKDYVYSNPEQNHSLTSGFIILKQQLNYGDEVVVQFNSNKTNILIVGYDDLEISNRYGLVYLSELKYPVSTEYMNIYINGEKLSAYDIDILSDKLIRIHHINRPIRSILITTNSKYKDSELEEFIECYQESPFEKLLENIFSNCDPSKKFDSGKPNVDYVYKVNPYYSDFVGELEDKYDNVFYKQIVDEILANGNSYDETSIFASLFPEPSETDPDYALKKEAWDKAFKFFEIYKTNHGFVPYVDSVLQAENPYSEITSSNFITDTLELMYINWLCKSGKTRSYNMKDKFIDPEVLEYFSVFENVIINDTIDIVVDSNRFYDGMYPDVCNDPIEINGETGEVKLAYPAVSSSERRRFFYNILLHVLEENPDDETLHLDPDTMEDGLIKKICDHKLSNILYPCDQPLEPDEDGIRYTGTNVDIVNCDYEREVREVEAAKAALAAVLARH